MSDEEQEQLFGAPRGKILMATVEVYTPAHAGMWEVRLTVTDAMRNRPMRLIVRMTGDQGIDTTVGRMTAIVLKTYYCRTDTIQRHMVRLGLALENDGYNVVMTGLRTTVLRTD